MSRTYNPRRMPSAKSRLEKSSRPRTNSPSDGTTAASGADENRHILYAIESTLVHCHQDDDRVDDAVALFTLNSMVRHDPPMMMPHAWVFAELVDARAALSGLTVATWNECLRLVMEAANRHSLMQQGDTQYLSSLSRSVA